MRDGELANELAEQTALAEAGEAAAVFLHELGNSLNNILLQTKLLQQQAGPELQPRLAETCKHIMQSAHHMKQLAQFRQLRRPRAYAVDLNRIVVENAGIEQVELGDDVTPLKGIVPDVKLLLRLLIKNATAGKIPAQITTRKQGDEIHLRVQGNGINVDDETLTQLFEPFHQVGAVPDSLELAMCRELVRRMRGHLTAERDGDGIVYLAKWPTGA